MNRRARTLCLALLTLLAPLAVPLAPTGHAQGVNADMEVVQVRVLNATFDHPDPARVVVTITNHGPGGGSGVLQFRYNDTDQRLTGDARSDQPFNTTDPIDPGQTVNFTLAWRPTEAQVGNGTIIVIASSASDPDPSDNRGEATTFVRRYVLATELLDEEEHHTLPGRATPYRVNVTNTGNAPLTLNTTATTEGEGWNATAPGPNRTLAVGQTTTVVALVRPPNHNQDRLGDGANESATLVVMAAENPNTRTIAPLPNTTVERSPDDAYAYGLELEVLEEVVALAPNVTALAQVRLTNPGNVHDAYRLDPVLAGALAGNVTLLPPDGLAALAPNATATFAVGLRLDRDVPRGVAGTLTIQGASVEQATFEPQATAADEVTVRVAAPDLTVTEVLAPASAYQAQERAQVQVRLENQGQGPAAATNLSLTALRGGFAFARASAQTPALSPGANATVPVALPVSELSGAYDVTVRVDPDDGVEENREGNNKATDQLFVRTAGLTVEPAEGLEVLPGQFVRYEHPPHVFEVKNAGNAREQVRVTIESAHGWVQEQTTLSIVAGGRAAVPVSFFVPALPGVEQDSLRVQATLLNLTEVSDVNRTTTTVADRSPPELVDLTYPDTVTATQPFRVETHWRDAIGVRSAAVVVQGPDNATQRIELEPTGNDTFAGNLTVFNLGPHTFHLEAVDNATARNRFTHPDPFRFNATYDRDPIISFLDEPSERIVRAGTPIPVKVVDPAGVRSVTYTAGSHSGELTEPFEVPTEGWGSGEREVTVTVTNRFERTATATATYAVDNDPPTLTDLELDPSEPGPGETVTIRVAGSGDPVAARALVEEAGSDEASTVTLRSTGDGAFEGETTLPEGRYQLTATVIDAAGNEDTRTVDVAVDASTVPGPGAVLALLSVLVGVMLSSRRRWGPR